MKKLLLSILLLGLVNVCQAQTEANQFKTKQINNSRLHHTELTGQFIANDFSGLWTKTANENIYGFIGDKYQRIKIKFIRIQKIPGSKKYNVSGKSMVKTNICIFKGTMTITNIFKLKAISTGIDDEYKNKGIKGQFVMIGDYIFSETKGQNRSGVFKGCFKSCFYIDKNNVAQYDNIDEVSDSYTNNEFVGNWTMYDSNFTQHCNWGDFRIPNSGDLDIGAGEFSPDDKYLKYGWQTVRDTYLPDKPKSAIALKAEKAQWWK